jgi:N-acetylated-alpha-linked acidic dipeptidase
MARIFGLEALRLADCDALPFAYEEYGSEVLIYIRDAATKADLRFGKGAVSLAEAEKAAERLTRAGEAIMKKQRQLPKDASRLNQALHAAEQAFLLPDGLPGRPWFRHAIYAPGKYTGYAAVVIPGVNEALDRGDKALVQRQAVALAGALTRAAESLEAASR